MREGLAFAMGLVSIMDIPRDPTSDGRLQAPVVRKDRLGEALTTHRPEDDP